MDNPILTLISWILSFFFFAGIIACILDRFKDKKQDWKTFLFKKGNEIYLIWAVIIIIALLIYLFARQ